jgi:hypothetical protein
MQANGVTMSAILAATGYIQADGIKDTMRSNDTVAAYRKRDTKRFPVASGTVEPLHGARSLDELERMKHELHLEGVVWTPFQGNIDHQPVRPPLKGKELGLLPSSIPTPSRTWKRYGGWSGYPRISNSLCVAGCVNDEYE